MFSKGHKKERPFTDCDCSANKSIESKNSIARDYCPSLPCLVQDMAEVPGQEIDSLLSSLSYFNWTKSQPKKDRARRFIEVW